LIYKLLIIYSLIFTGLLSGQQPFGERSYDFINYDANQLHSYEDDNLDKFFGKMDDLILTGNKKINIFHIGDSHIQGGSITNKLRERFQTFSPGLNGGRGFLFPYALAKTNSPKNFSVRYSGAWKGCRNVERKKNCILGVSGISATTYSSNASVTITLNPPEGLQYDFNKIRIFHNENTSYLIYPQNSEINKNSVIIRHEHFTEINLNDYAEEITIQFKKSDVGTENSFVLYGISLDNDDTGIAYHTAGVNGAEVSSYLRCNLFAEHIKEINPDMVIISLGTNDAYVKNFDDNDFKMKYDTLLTTIKAQLPNAAIILTTPGDNYRYRRYVNRSNQKAADAIHSIAKEMNFTVWDFYEVMGGLQSISSWYRAGLTARDRLHYSISGYELQANLFFDAFLKAYDKHIDSKISITKTKIKRY
jgi:lysophospholipase L1-like esterase